MQAKQNQTQHFLSVKQMPASKPGKILGTYNKHILDSGVKNLSIAALRIEIFARNSKQCRFAAFRSG